MHCPLPPAWLFDPVLSHWNMAFSMYAVLVQSKELLQLVAGSSAPPRDVAMRHVCNGSQVIDDLIADETLCPLTVASGLQSAFAEQVPTQLDNTVPLKAHFPPTHVHELTVAMARFDKHEEPPHRTPPVGLLIGSISIKAGSWRGSPPYEYPIWQTLD